MNRLPLKVWLMDLGDEIGALHGVREIEWSRWHACGFSPAEAIAARDLEVTERLRASLGVRETCEHASSPEAARTLEAA